MKMVQPIQALHIVILENKKKEKNMKNNVKVKTKEDIKKDLISKDLNELIKPLFMFVLLSVLFGYLGYRYCIDNNLDIIHGIVFGSLFPLIPALIIAFDYGSFFIYIVYTIAYISLIGYVPTLIGFIILFIIIAIFIICFIHIEKKDRTEEISKIYYYSNNMTTPVKTKTTEETGEKYIPVIDDEEPEEDIEKDIFEEEEELEYECERCFKKISLEEYELNDFMCEDCYQEVHTDKNGNFHDDEYFDV